MLKVIIGEVINIIVVILESIGYKLVSWGNYLKVKYPCKRKHDKAKKGLLELIDSVESEKLNN